MVNYFRSRILSNEILIVLKSDRAQREYYEEVLF